MRQWVCDRCTRTVHEGSPELRWWLIGQRANGLPVVRCGLHITEWSLRQAQLPRTLALRQWARRARQRIAERGAAITTPYLMMEERDDEGTGLG